MLVRPSNLGSCLALSLVLLGCVGGPRSTRAPAHEIAGWIDDATSGDPTRADPERLDQLAEAGPAGRVVRLDRLLDLYDAARFAADKQARESLWLALGGDSTSRGIAASREVILRLLDEAYALEDHGAELDDDQARFVADAIMLLSADLFLPDSADALIAQTLAYRVLTEQGHPRIADNARWRLYDHVRGVLEGALEVSPDLRADVVVHALYAEREDISAWLEDSAIHVRPPLPSPSELWELLAQQRDALAELPRWQAVVEARRPGDDELRATVIDLLPRPRASDWVLAELPRGTAQHESLAPVLLLRRGEAVVEPTSSEPHSTSADGPELVGKLEGALARDGRGIVLLATDPSLPAPELAAALRALADARVSTIELAVHEPRLIPADADEDTSDSAFVVAALPLYVAQADDLAPGARAIREARIHVQLDGHGPRVSIDGRWLSAAPQLPSDLAVLIQQLRRAFPRERVVSLSLAANVQPRQIIDLLAALVGGRDPAFLAVGWLPDTAAIALSNIADSSADRALATRVALADRVREVPPLLPGAGSLRDPKLDLPTSTSEADRARIERAVHGLWDCVPELERAIPERGLALELELAEGRVRSHEATAKDVPAARLDAFEGCVDERLVGFTLRDQHDAMTIRVVFEPRAPKP